MLESFTFKYPWEFVLESDGGRSSAFAFFDTKRSGRDHRVMTPRRVHENQASCVHSTMLAVIDFEQKYSDGITGVALPAER